MAGFFGMGNYENSGSGISKNKQNKGRLGLFFEILGVRFWKLLELNFIYFIFCLPVITIGPATAGLTKVLKNYSIDKNAYVWADFWETFKKNFSKAFLLGIVDIIAYGGIIAGCWLYPYMASLSGSNFYYVLMALTISVGITFTIMNFYLYLMLVSTDLSMKNIVKNSLVLSFAAPKPNILSMLVLIFLPTLLFVLIVNLNMQFLILLPFMPAALIGFVVCYNCYPVIQKYVINPYYESRGEQNPEIRIISEEADEAAVFEDMGGREEPVIKNKGNKKKIIS